MSDYVEDNGAMRPFCFLCDKEIFEGAVLTPSWTFCKHCSKYYANLKAELDQIFQEFSDKLENAKLKFKYKMEKDLDHN